MAEDYSCVVELGASFERVLLETYSKVGHEGKGRREAGGAGKTLGQHGAS